MQVDDEVAEEFARPLVLRSPPKVSQTEIDEHNATGHVVYRSWCPVCVANKGHGQGHAKAPEEDETAVPTILSDYGFLREDDNESMPILVLKCKKTKRLSDSIWFEVFCKLH